MSAYINQKKTKIGKKAAITLLHKTRDNTDLKNYRIRYDLRFVRSWIVPDFFYRSWIVPDPNYQPISLTEYSLQVVYKNSNPQIEQTTKRCTSKRIG